MDIVFTFDFAARTSYAPASEAQMTHPTNTPAASRPVLPSAQSLGNSPGVEGRRARTPSQLILTNSRRSSFAACPRRHWWSYELGIRKSSPQATLGRGSAYHAALDILNLGGKADQAIQVARDGTLDPTDRELVACMVAGWAWRWSAHPIGKILASEIPFEIRPVKGARWVFKGKIDAIAELPDGRVAVVEYKTTSDDLSPTSDYWKRLLIDQQITGYWLGAKSLGFTPQTVIYDAARTPGMRPRLLSRSDPDGAREPLEDFSNRLLDDMQSRPDWYFGRQEIPRIEADFGEWLTDMTHTAELIRSSQKKGLWSRNTDACVRWGRCPYFGPCSESHDPTTAGTPSGFVQVPDVHAELTIRGQEILDDAD